MSTNRESSQTAWGLRIVWTGVLAILIGLIVFWPDPGDVAGSSGLTAWLDQLHDAGSLTWVTISRLEFTANIIMFLPVGATAWWWTASVANSTLIGFCATAFIEIMQSFAVPGRFSDIRDIIANTLGAIIGAAGCALVHYLLARRSSQTPEI